MNHTDHLQFEINSTLGHWDDYWKINQTASHDAAVDRRCDQILATCGVGKILDLGSGDGALVAAFLRRGIDAWGLDSSAVAVENSNKWTSRRFIQGHAD